MDVEKMSIEEKEKIYDEFVNLCKNSLKCKNCKKPLQEWDLNDYCTYCESEMIDKKIIKVCIFCGRQFNYNSSKISCNNVCSNCKDNG